MTTGEPTAASAALDEFFQTLYRLRPVDATFIGHHDQDHRLPDWSLAGHEAATASWSACRDRLRAALGGATDDEVILARDWSQIDVALAVSHCDLTLDELAGSHMSRGNPSLAIGEAAFAVISLITRDFLPASHRARHLESRLRHLPAFLAAALEALRNARVPGAWRAKALTEARATSLLLEEGLPKWCAAMALPQGTGLSLGEASRHALGGVHAFTSALEQLPAAENEVIACGEDMLGRCVQRGHWVTHQLDDLRQEARTAFAEARARLGEMVRTVGAASIAEVHARLVERHPAPDEYYSAFSRVWDACRATAEQHALVSWPDSPIRYVPIPEWTRMAAPALYYLFYRSPAPLDEIATHEYVVTPLDGLDGLAREEHLRRWNDSVIKLNHVVHHGGLGHHVQNWYAYRAPSRVGRVAAADCASRIAMLLGGTMAEGWACYATDLMDEVGFLTADERVAEQHTRVRLLGRAIVDLEFHTGRLSLEQVVRLYLEEVGMGVDAARGEAVKNSMFPGTAVMYWLGTQGIHDLRRAMAIREGSTFAVGAFHDRFLSHGAIPVALTSRLMLGGDQVYGARK